MFCPKCGAAINENQRVCPACGHPIAGEENNVTAATTYKGPLANPVPVLVWGILGLSFALSFVLSFLGIIFSAVGLHKATSYYAFTGSAPSNMVRIGRKLSIAGLIVGIILTILFILYVAMFIELASNGTHDDLSRSLNELFT